MTFNYPHDLSESFGNKANIWFTWWSNTTVTT